MNLLQPKQLYLPFIEKQNEFCQDECDFIKQLGFEFNFAQSLVSSGLNVSKRKSENSFIPYNKETEWIYQKIYKIALDSNQFYNFNLNYFGEDLQFAKYSVGDFYGFHEDIGSGYNSLRKLSLIINLSDPNTYKGGGLEFFAGGKTQKTCKKLGCVIIFPSFVPHRVTKVLRGERFSLTSWIHGPPFS